MSERIAYEPPIASRDIPDSLAFLDTVIALIDATDRDAWWEGPTFRSPCQTKHCVLSHVAEQLGMAAMDRFQNEWSTSYVIGAQINDKPSEQYPQAHPKDRVAAYLQNLRNGTEKDVQVSTYETFIHHEQQDAFAAAIHAAICEASPEECAEENGACQKGARAVQNMLTASQPLDEKRGTIIDGLIDCEGGRILTAEEWADFLNVIWEGRGDYCSRDRLREKFPTSEHDEARLQWNPETVARIKSALASTEGDVEISAEVNGNICAEGNSSPAVVHVHHHDMEATAASYNEGFADAVRQLTEPAQATINSTLNVPSATEAAETEWAIEFPGGICNISFDPADPEEMLQWIREGKLIRREVTTGPWTDAISLPAPTAEEETKAEAVRTHTPAQHNPETGRTTITVQRSCNRCGRNLGDATEKELDACVSGAPLPDVHDECGCASSPVVPAPAEDDSACIPAPADTSLIGVAAAALSAALDLLDPHESGAWEHAWRTLGDLRDCAEREKAIAPTESGPWPSWDRIQTKNVERILRLVSYNSNFHRVFREQARIAAESLAPFVAAEETDR